MIRDAGVAMQHSSFELVGKRVVQKSCRYDISCKRKVPCWAGLQCDLPPSVCVCGICAWLAEAMGIGGAPHQSWSQHLGLT